MASPSTAYAIKRSQHDHRHPGRVRQNPQRRQIVQVLSYLQAFGEQGYSANMTSEKRAKLAKGTRRKYGYELVVIRPSRKPQPGGKQLAPGIWQRTYTGFGSSLQPLMMFVRAPSYRVRLPLQEIGNRAMASYFPGEFNKVFSS